MTFECLYIILVDYVILVGCFDATLTLSLFMFLAAFLSYFFVFCFTCRNLTLPLFKKDVFVRKSYFSPTRSISAVMK